VAARAVASAARAAAAESRAAASTSARVLGERETFEGREFLVPHVIHERRGNHKEHVGGSEALDALVVKDVGAYGIYCTIGLSSNCTMLLLGVGARGPRRAASLLCECFMIYDF